MPCNPMRLGNEFRWITPDGAGIIGTIQENGVVRFVVTAGEGSSVRGTELFNRMMAEFGEEVRAIEGVWRKGSLDLPSTNIDKVNELTALGVPIEEAIRNTWTVTRAFKLGFTRVRVLGNLEGQPGAYTKIDVLIEKEP